MNKTNLIIISILFLLVLNLDLVGDTLKNKSGVDEDKIEIFNDSLNKRINQLETEINDLKHEKSVWEAAYHSQGLLYSIVITLIAAITGFTTFKWIKRDFKNKIKEVQVENDKNLKEIKHLKYELSVTGYTVSLNELHKSTYTNSQKLSIIINLLEYCYNIIQVDKYSSKEVNNSKFEVPISNIKYYLETYKDDIIKDFNKNNEFDEDQLKSGKFFVVEIIKNIKEIDQSENVKNLLVIETKFNEILKSFI